MSARGPELPPDIIFDVDPAPMQKAAYGDVKQLPPQNVKQSGPATEVEMLNKSENVKQLDDPDVKHPRLSFLGVRIPSGLLDTIDRLATKSHRSRSDLIRELLQSGLDAKHHGR